MSIAEVQSRIMSPMGLSNLWPAAASDDPVARGLRDSARRMIGVAIFSGVINILMLSGSLYMLQVYDRVIPSRNIATLFGLSLMVVLAYLTQGYFDALRTRMLCWIATMFDAGLQGGILHEVQIGRRAQSLLGRREIAAIAGMEHGSIKRLIGDVDARAELIGVNILKHLVEA